MITCIICDDSGNQVGRFEPKGEKNLLDEAADAGIEISFSCHAGACMSCALKIIKGEELIEQEKDGPKYMDTEEDVFLSCIAGVKQEFVDDDQNHILEVEIIG